METQKKRRGDRKDGRLMRELDSLHYVTGILSVSYTHLTLPTT